MLVLGVLVEVVPRGTSRGYKRRQQHHLGHAVLLHVNLCVQPVVLDPSENLLGALEGGRGERRGGGAEVVARRYAPYSQPCKNLGLRSSGWGLPHPSGPVPLQVVCGFIRAVGKVGEGGGGGTIHCVSAGAQF